MKYSLQSSIVIDADLKKVRDFVSDFSTWPSWSPWSVIEPDHKGKTSGKAGEIGHKMEWDGKVIGSGEQNIAAFEGDSILYNLEFFKPFKSKAKARFDFEKVKGGTKVTWHMHSSMPFFLFFMIPKMKAWIEMDYQRGLIMLKAIMEEGSVKAKTTLKGMSEVEGFSYVGIKRTCSFEDMPKQMSADFEELMEFLKEKGKKARHWVTLYPKTNMVKKQFTFISCMSSEDLEGLEMPENFVTGKIDSGKALEVHHEGAYLFLGNAWSMGMMYFRAQKLKGRAVPMEYYFNSPQSTKPEGLKTSIYFPVK